MTLEVLTLELPFLGLSPQGPSPPSLLLLDLRAAWAEP